MLLFALLALGAQLLGAWPRVQAADTSRPKPWVFFDLGENSLVSTPKDPASGDIVSLAWIRYLANDGKVTDAHAYLTRLRASGYSIGLVMNLPADWGDPQLEKANAWLSESNPARKEELAASLTAAKLELVRDYFEGRGPGDEPRRKPRWNDPQYPSVDFSLFPSGSIFVPFFQRNRKPMDGPARSSDQLFLYRQAVALAARHGAKALYQATDARDIAGAREAGMLVRQLPYDPDRRVQQKGYYLDEAAIERMTRP
ncbi:MAG: hypothetical protein HY816_21815 [Candidatus Wallbacteria bacterium]|nr:hypothetical protein [Candidatus Wallbacteria bacterium]